MSEDQSGRILSGRYYLSLRLGEGSMGDVYRAWDSNLRTYVVVKLLRKELVGEVGWDEAYGRFELEARSGAKLRSPHAVKVTEFGVGSRHDDAYIVMEYLEGNDLETHLGGIGRLRVGMTATVLEHVADAMAEAHSHGIVHRDLKPENIFLTFPGGKLSAKVIDFGIARWLDQGPTRLEPATAWKEPASRALLGTPEYMSPEQLAGGAVDHRTDIWAMGVIAFECITGQDAFPLVSSPDPAVVFTALLDAINNHPLPVPSMYEGVPKAFDQWFYKCAARNPDERFQSAREAARALRRVANTAVPPNARSRRHWTVMVSSAGAVLIGGLGFLAGRLSNQAGANTTQSALASPMGAQTSRCAGPARARATAAVTSDGTSDSEPPVDVSSLPLESVQRLARASADSDPTAPSLGSSVDAAASLSEPDRLRPGTPGAGAATQRPMLAISVPATVAGLDGLRIELDGTELAPGRWNTAVEVEQGERVVSVSARGRIPWQKRVAARPDNGLVVVAVPQLTKRWDCLGDGNPYCD